MSWLEEVVRRAHEKRGLHIFVIVLRMLIAFAFIPAGLKKVLGEPFTDPTNSGTFHNFLHAFHDTGLFYSFVGATQLLAAVLLMTQRFATLGAALLFPILTAIFVFCWSTMVVPTATVVTFMCMGLLLLMLWDFEKWKPLFYNDGSQFNSTISDLHPTVDMKLWQGCGWLILLLYFGHTAITGEVYRPKGAEWSDPSFMLLGVIALLPLITFVIDSRRAEKNTS